MEENSEAILCVGEVLWDALPKGLFLGGAPFNVACHLHALGENVAAVSRVGGDALGREALRRLRARGMTTELVQVDDALETGLVEVALDADGDAGYTIAQPVAWDALALTDALAERAAQAAAVVFGSLAQRQERTRRTVRGLCEAASDAGALTVFDVNLRPPYTPRSVVEPALAWADVIKLNEEELREISGWLGLSGDLQARAATLAERCDCRAVCVTRGADGSALWHEGEWARADSYAVQVQDTVGAGDAFLSALLAGLLAGHDSAQVLRRASRLGAYVASRAGATPEYDLDSLDMIDRLALDAPGDSSSNVPDGAASNASSSASAA